MNPIDPPRIRRQPEPAVAPQPTPDSSRANRPKEPPKIQTAAEPPQLATLTRLTDKPFPRSESLPAESLPADEGVPLIGGVSSPVNAPCTSSVPLPPVLEPESALTDASGVRPDVDQRQSSVRPAAKKRSWLNAMLRLPFKYSGVAWRFLSIVVLLALVAAIPVVQLASLGYLLFSAARLANGRPWRECLPGARTAGRLTQFATCAFLLWLPVWFVTDLAYSAQLVGPGSNSAAAWRRGAFLVAGLWVLLVGWAAVRGGKIRHFLWPAPVRFIKESWRPSTLAQASDDLYDLFESLQLPTLWFLGLKAAFGALVWTCVPVSLMIIGLRGDAGATGLLGLAGALGMMAIMLYLPFLQIQMATTGKFLGMFDLRAVRTRFLYSPVAHAFALLLLCIACLPLYLLRIEATPAALLWAPSLVFVLFMMPVKWMLGAAMGYGDSRRRQARLADDHAQNIAGQETEAADCRNAKADRFRSGRRHWALRWPARMIGLASVSIYVGALYVAQLAAGQGILVMYFQHAFLVPAPLISS